MLEALSPMKFDYIPVIDLFAGPGGLGEGFSALNDHGSTEFRICLSIEKEYSSYRTLRLRSFFRKVPFDQIKEAYVEFAKTEKSEEDEKNLYSEFEAAKKESEWEVLCQELGGLDFPAVELDSIIREHLNGSKMWVLIGGPPCQAYSLAGRSRMSRIRKEDLDKFEKDERHYLYQHYLRIIAHHEPPVFVMENVKGMLSSTIRGKLIIDKILKDLRHPDRKKDLSYNLYPFNYSGNRQINLFDESPGFDASEFVLKCEEYGIPQTRHRVIILGVRSDINFTPKVLQKKRGAIPLSNVINDLPALRSGISIQGDQSLSWEDHIRKINKYIRNGAVDTNLRRQISKNLKYLGNFLQTGEEWQNYRPGRPKNIIRAWFREQDIGGVCNHIARSHMPSDLLRYFFAACFAQMQDLQNAERISPLLCDFPIELLPNHKNINTSKPDKAIFDDRFRVQPLNRPATTVTSHIAKDGHYFIHPDPLQCRSLTVREAARIQTFQDNYIFLGSRTSQYRQVGNAVPPLLAKQLANIVQDLLERWVGS